MSNVLLIFGTRPEAIKMAPVYFALKKSKILNPKVITTGQHQIMLKQVLDFFQIEVDTSLNVMREGQSLSQLTCSLLSSLEQEIPKLKPDAILIHGDTTTTMAAALSAFYSKIKIGHVEAGLRTNDLFNPFPEELNRKAAALVADWHFSPNLRDKQNLINEGIDPARIYVTGNTVVDALSLTLEKIDSNQDYKRDIKNRLLMKLKQNVFNQRYVIITMHRRENFGRGVENLCSALKALSIKFPNLLFIFPVHLNPFVFDPVQNQLSHISNVILTDPLPYQEFCFLLSNCALVITDSGGIQEETTFLNKPLLVTREKTERESPTSNKRSVVGMKTEDIIASVENALIFPDNRNKEDNKDFFGVGDAAVKINNHLERLL